MGRIYILYIYAHGREGGDGRWTEPRSKTAGHSGYNGRGTGDGQAPQPSCGEQDGREGTGGMAGTEGRRNHAAKLRGTVAIVVGFGRSILSVWQKHLEHLAEALWVYIFFTIVVCILFLKVIIGRKCLWNG